VKFGSQAKVDLNLVITSNIDFGCITHSVGDCIAKERCATIGNMKHAINPMS